VEVIKQCAKPAYIIMDDGEQLVAQRPLEEKKIDKDDTKADWIVDKEKLTETIAQRRIALLQAILGELSKKNRRIGFAITTNRPDVIDREFEKQAQKISILPPEKDERKKIIITHLSSIFNNNNDVLSFFNRKVLENMAVNTEGFTGRNIVKMLEDLHACIRIKNNVTDEMIEAAIASVRPSVGL
jgi:SpoVK/Ycf46/Vps4 family AAA+-type ATPase